MKINKKNRQINKAKKSFIKWAKWKRAEGIEVYEGDGSDEWDYYRMIDLAIGENIFIVTFMIWYGRTSISISNDNYNHSNLTIGQFKDLLRHHKDTVLCELCYSDISQTGLCVPCDTDVNFL